MKTIPFATIVWLMIAAVCYGQRNAVDFNSGEAFDRMQRQLHPTPSPKQEAAARERKQRQIEHDRAMEVGRSVFGESPRWTASNVNPTGGTLIDKAPADFAIGDWGCTSTTFRLVSKISDSAFLVTTTQEPARAMLVRGLDTSKATDDIEFILQHPIVIEHTYSYTAVSGAQKTVLILDCNNRRFANLGPAVRPRKRATPFEMLNQALKLEAKRLSELYPRYTDVSDKAVDRQFEFVKRSTTEQQFYDRSYQLQRMYANHFACSHTGKTEAHVQALRKGLAELDDRLAQTFSELVRNRQIAVKTT